MGRKWYLTAAAVGLLVGIAVTWYVEPGTAAGSAFLIVAGGLAGLALAWFAVAFIPIRSETYAWKGISGRSYVYAISDLYIRFADYQEQVVPCNFAFVKMEDGVSCPLFFSETYDAVKQRFQRHMAWEEAVRLGVTHIHYRTNRNEDARRREVDDLVVAYAPPLNGRVRLVGRTSELTTISIGGLQGQHGDDQ